MKLTSLLLYSFAMLVGYSPSEPKSHQMAGMDISWHFDGDQFCCEISSPAKGWIAIGLNEDREFVKSNLIMAAEINGQTVFEDQFITGMGIHPKVSTLGGQSHVTHAEIISTEQGRKLKLEIKTRPQDDLHYKLLPNRRVYLTLAYSHHNDFNHHSTQRQSVWINL